MKHSIVIACIACIGVPAIFGLRQSDAHQSQSGALNSPYIPSLGDLMGGPNCGISSSPMRDRLEIGSLPDMSWDKFAKIFR